MNAAVLTTLHTTIIVFYSYRVNEIQENNKMDKWKSLEPNKSSRLNSIRILTIQSMNGRCVEDSSNSEI